MNTVVVTTTSNSSSSNSDQFLPPSLLHKHTLTSHTYKVNAIHYLNKCIQFSDSNPTISNQAKVEKALKLLRGVLSPSPDFVVTGGSGRIGSGGSGGSVGRCYYEADSLLRSAAVGKLQL